MNRFDRPRDVRCVLPVDTVPVPKPRQCNMGESYPESWELHVLREPKTIVAYVCKFPDPDGMWVVSWNSDPAGTEIWPSKAKLMAVHGHGGRELVPMNKFDIGGPE